MSNPDDIVYNGNNLETELIIKNPDGKKKDLVMSTQFMILTTQCSSYEEKYHEKDETLYKTMETRLITPGKYRIDQMRDGNTVICTDCFRNKALY
jgi:hypothetical protein